MQITLDLKNYFADRNPSGPMIETALSLSHTTFIPARVHANVRRDSVIHPILHPTQSLFDSFIRDAKLRCADAAVVVAHAKAVVTPYYGCAAGAASCWDARTPFGTFFILTGFRGEPIEMSGSRGERAVPRCLGEWG